MNRFETSFVACYAYFTAKLHQFKKKTLGQFENQFVFVIMSPTENIRLIARTSSIRIAHLPTGLILSVTGYKMKKTIGQQERHNLCFRVQSNGETAHTVCL